MIMDHHKKHLWTLLGLLLLAGIALALSFAPRRESPVAGNPSNGTNLPHRSTLTGEYVCLPHKDMSGPITLECALGLKVDDNNYYALDLGELLYSENNFNYPTGTRLKVSGSLVPIEAVSSDVWQKYLNVRGILRVESAQQVK